MRFAKLGQTKPSDPTGLGMRRPLLRKETGERKSYAIDRPLFLIFFEVGQIENEMHKINRGRVPLFFGLRAARPTEVPKAFGAYTYLIRRPKKGLSVAPLESKPFEAPVVVAVGRAFVLIAPDSDLYDLRVVQSQPLP
ncbi:UNVERIFIED_CONTAM: hypothetical protein Scaly_2976800 [Sesamum calycinum]|uniref:Uncharacterized protein n=3 Tax=Sesamum TaxID=4181 RepID=A0AAW2SGZ1_9LAMI